MTTVIELPTSGQSFREITASQLEILTPYGPPEIIETHGLLVEGISRRSTRIAPVSVVFGAKPRIALPQLTTTPTVHRLNGPKNRSHSVTIAQVGSSHWVAELVGHFSRITVRCDDREWTEELGTA